MIQNLDLVYYFDYLPVSRRKSKLLLLFAAQVGAKYTHQLSALQQLIENQLYFLGKQK
jgi:hypothetical protein